jgi:hypothetical protein
MAWYVPVEQLMQLDAPAAEYVPALQLTQVDDAEAPVDAE